ncbi:hypothetical protein [Sphingobium aromaticiconvertens]|uniref:hypothetical protein n=1 Tax=Sphingobium aromaticiconvertens TaxID=365341 RepID=UPI00301867BE
MKEPKAFNVHFRCEDRELALEWLKKFPPIGACAYGDLRKIGNIEFEKYMFVVQFTNEDDARSMRGHFYPSTGQHNN